MATLDHLDRPPSARTLDKPRGALEVSLMINALLSPRAPRKVLVATVFTILIQLLPATVGSSAISTNALAQGGGSSCSQEYPINAQLSC
jgi:hypothetical protein